MLPTIQSSPVIWWEGVDEPKKILENSNNLSHSKPSSETISIIVKGSRLPITELPITNFNDPVIKMETESLHSVTTEKSNSELNTLQSSESTVKLNLDQDQDNKPDEEQNLLEKRIRHYPEPIIVPNTLPVPVIITSPCSSGQATPLSPRNKEQLKAWAKLWKAQGDQATVTMLSALYCIILVVMGLAFPVSQVISSKIPSSYYEGFYVYLYFVATAFLSYVYILLRSPFNIAFACRTKWAQIVRSAKSKTGSNESNSYGSSLVEAATNKLRARLGRQLDPTKSANHGSFYLRMGAVVFGIGSMIYSGLDFGQYFDLYPDPLCDNLMIAVTPAARMLFTFIQMYFVFLNAKMQMVKHRNTTLARFGLMHMIATNLCVWLNVIIQETKHEILFFDHHSHEHGHSETDQLKNPASEIELHADVHNNSMEPHRRSVRGSLVDECRRTDLMGSLVQDASPFLFPCAIEYSLICAAIMYEIWKHSSGHRPLVDTPSGTPRTLSVSSNRRSPHHYSVDCTNANKGLFFGIFVLVLTIISMILFFVLINRNEYKALAITEVNLAELILYTMTFVAVVMGVIQVRQLRFDPSRSLDLDNVLLIVAQTGVIAYNIFTIIGAQFSDHNDTLLILVTALAALMQAITQTLFILDASKRNLYSSRQQKKKPGREVVTFLLVTNFAMWAVTTLEKSRADSHPLQSAFFGKWPWAIITNVSTPLAIFYRYHSTVCLCEIWKRCYKVKNDGAA